MAALAAEGFRAVRVLAEHSGKNFVEGDESSVLSRSRTRSPASGRLTRDARPRGSAPAPAGGAVAAVTGPARVLHSAERMGDQAVRILAPTEGRATADVFSAAEIARAARVPESEVRLLIAAGER